MEDRTLKKNQTLTKKEKDPNGLLCKQAVQTERAQQFYCHGTEKELIPGIITFPGWETSYFTLNFLPLVRIIRYPGVAQGRWLERQNS